jgi:SNF2 family DNA or RNA helicase
MGIFGPLPAFELRYIRRTPTKVTRGSAVVTENKISGYKNFREFKRRIDPFILRRLATDPNVAAELPPVTVENVWLELPMRQRRAYDMARRGVIAMFAAGDRRKARSNFHTLQQACDSTAFFGDEYDTAQSVKIDWLCEAMNRQLASEKVVVFCKYKRTIEHVRHRLRAMGIRSVAITGEVSADDRSAAQHAFWTDSSVRVIIGTSAMERALNLQNSAYVLNINQMWNPARMQQILGRVHRIGSKHAKVVMINLLIDESIESKLVTLQARRQAVHNGVFDESSDIFEELTDAELKDLLRD